MTMKLIEPEDACCENCVFWKNKYYWMESETQRVYAAECHRYPPKTNGHDTFYPKVKSTNWCGEHKWNTEE